MISNSVSNGRSSLAFTADIIIRANYVNQLRPLISDWCIMSSCSALISANLDTFEDGLKENLLRGIYGFGLEKTSPVQQVDDFPAIIRYFTC